MNLLKRKLSNGVTVLMEKRDLPLVCLGIANKYGGAYEGSEIKGVAHVIEHLLFTGTEKRSHEDISREIEKKGGVLNAYTSHESTNYWFKMPSEHVFSGLDILIDMLKNPKFDEEKFEKEKKVILEEIKMYHDNPRLHVFEQIERNLFESPFGDLIIGTKDSVKSLDRSFVLDLYKKVYSPKNFVVSIVGNADFEKICDYLEKSFEPSEGGANVVEIKKKNGESIEERPGIDQAHLVFAIHAPKYAEKERYAFELLDAYLGSGMSSKLFLEIREKRGLAYAVKSSYDCGINYAVYSVYVGTTKDKVDEVKRIIIEEFEKVKDMSEEDLKEAKEKLIGLRKVMSEESFQTMHELVDYEFAGITDEFYCYEEKIMAVNLEDVKRLAKFEAYSVAAVVPK